MPTAKKAEKETNHAPYTGRKMTASGATESVEQGRPSMLVRRGAHP